MRGRRGNSLLLLVGAMLALSLIGPAARGPLAPAARGDSLAALADNPNPPASPVKLIFIHHSTGENWLADGDGGLGLALRDNNYFVSDTNYGWGPDNIGDNTDIGHYWLVNDWLDGYEHNNVAVFDFYNVLTSNGGNRNSNDLGWESGNHHHWWNRAVQYLQTVSNNYSAYRGGSGGGSHPTAPGN